MILTVDPNTREIRAAGSATRAAAGRRDKFWVSVGLGCDLGDGGQVRVGVKADRSGGFLALGQNPRRNGEGAATIYRVWLDLHTEEMAAAFASSPPSLATALEVEWESAAGERRTSKPLVLDVFDEYITGEEGAPTPADPGTSAGLPLAVGENFRLVAVDTGIERGVKVQVRGAGGAWLDQVSFVEGY